MKSPSPKKGGLALDKLRAECALSAAPIPGIEVTVQKNTTVLFYDVADHSMLVLG